MSLSKEQQEPTEAAFHRVVRGQAFFRRLSGALGVLVVLQGLFSAAMGAALWVERETEVSRAAERLETEPFARAVDDRIDAALDSPRFRTVVRSEVRAELDDAAFASAAEVAELKRDLGETRRAMVSLQRELSELLGELRARRSGGVGGGA